MSLSRRLFPSMSWRSCARADAQPKPTEDVVIPGMLRAPQSQSPNSWRSSKRSRR